MSFGCLKVPAAALVVLLLQHYSFTSFSSLILKLSFLEGGVCLHFFLCCRMAYVEFKTEAEANKALEEKQGTEIEGRAVVIDFTGEKSQQEHQKGTFHTFMTFRIHFHLFQKFVGVWQLEILQEN